MLENARPHVAALQLDVYFCWTTDGEDATLTEDEAPSVKTSWSVSLGTDDGGAWLGQLTASTRMFPAVTDEVKEAAQAAALQLETVLLLG